MSINNNEVIYHKTWVDLPHVNECIEVTQIYSKKTRTVLCCIIPWDVAAKRTPNGVAYNKDECILVWPDHHADVYDKNNMEFKRNIGDAAFVESVWQKFWEYHGLRGEPHATPTERQRTRTSDLAALEKTVDTELHANLEATIDDIFEDVRDLVSAVPDPTRKQELAALVDVKQKRFVFLYDDGRYQHNGQNSYGLLFVFIHMIKEDLRRDDNQAHTVAVFLMQFCADMYVMWGTRAAPGETHFGRIKERMLRYYKTCPNSLRIAKLKRMHA
jgi:hypothetical protein